MKQTSLLTALQNGVKRIPMGLGFALALTFPHLNATADDVDLGTATNFAVLGAAAISSTGTTVITGALPINGNVGTTPITGAAITGLTAGQVNGKIYTTDGTGPTGNVMDPGRLTAAANDLYTAYTHAKGLLPIMDLTGKVLGSGGTVGTASSPLNPGVYSFSSSAQITGTLYLNDNGETDPLFVFQIGSTLTTASYSSFVEQNPGAGTIAGSSVFWQVGSSASLGTYSVFDGNILAYTDITDYGYSTVDGRLLAIGGGKVGGAVTLDYTTINTPPGELPAVGGGTGGGGNAPDTGRSLLLLGSALAALFAFARRFSLLGRKPA